jgi:DNA-binding transcriptional MerR regulator
MSTDKLTTKQFADICKVEKRTLHYYDEIGLLKPVEVKGNGYRIYSISQFDTMSMIKALQSVGMALNDIKSLMNERDLFNCKDTLNKQIQLIKEKQEELKRAEQILVQTTKQLNNYLEIGCNKLFIEETQDIYLITEEISREGTIFVNYITSGYYLGVIMDEKEPAAPKYIFKRADSANCSNAVKCAGTYACIYKSVQNGKISEAINEFIEALPSEHIIAEGPLYVDSIASDFVQRPNQEYIFKLSICTIHH